MKGPHTAFHCVCLHVWAVGRVAACWASVEGFFTMWLKLTLLLSLNGTYFENKLDTLHSSDVF